MCRPLQARLSHVGKMPPPGIEPSDLQSDALPTELKRRCKHAVIADGSAKATGRIELPTLGLQDQCSATELSRHGEQRATK